MWSIFLTKLFSITFVMDGIGLFCCKVIRSADQFSYLQNKVVKVPRYDLEAYIKCLSAKQGGDDGGEST